MSEREPGRMAAEAYWWPKAWADMDDDEKAAWLRVESTIRADEAAKVRAATIEECAEPLASFIAEHEEHADDLTEYGKIRVEAARQFLAAIRALGGDNG